VWREKKREDWIVETGLLMRRMIFTDIFSPVQTAARFLEALKRGARGVA